VLDHPTRAAIYDAVRAEPGVSPHDLVDRIGAGWSTVMYHLTVLERNELIIASRDGRYRRYFDRTSGRYANGRKQVVSVLKNETTAAIAAFIRDNPGLVQRRLAEHFGLAPSSVHWHVKRLVDAGLLVKEKQARMIALLPGPAWADLDPSDLLPDVSRASPVD
jgi:predicted transcriptional regulator